MTMWSTKIVTFVRSVSRSCLSSSSFLVRRLLTSSRLETRPLLSVNSDSCSSHLQMLDQYRCMKKKFLEMKADILYIFMSEGTFTDHFLRPSDEKVHRALDLSKPLFSSNLDLRVFIWSMACCFSSISSTKVSSMPPNSSLQSLSLLHAIKYQAEGCS